MTEGGTKASAPSRRLTRIMRPKEEQKKPAIVAGTVAVVWCSPVLVFGYGMSSRVSATLFATARWTIMSGAIRRATQACL